MIGIATGFTLAMTGILLLTQQSQPLFLTPGVSGQSPKTQGFYLPIIGGYSLFSVDSLYLIVEFTGVCGKRRLKYGEEPDDSDCR